MSLIKQAYKKVQVLSEQLLDCRCWIKIPALIRFHLSVKKLALYYVLRKSYTNSKIIENKDLLYVLSFLRNKVKKIIHERHFQFNIQEKWRYLYHVFIVFTIKNLLNQTWNGGIFCPGYWIYRKEPEDKNASLTKNRVKRWEKYGLQCFLHWCSIHCLL